MLSAFDVAQLLGFFQLFAQIGKPPPICRLGLLVEHLARISETADMDPRLFEILIAVRQVLRRSSGFIIAALACDSSRQIEHMKFGARMAQEMGEVPESFGVLQAKGFSIVADGPVLALFAENTRVDGGNGRPGVAGTR
jgi:hypothetical protein